MVAERKEAVVKANVASSIEMALKKRTTLEDLVCSAMTSTLAHEELLFLQKVRSMFSCATFAAAGVSRQRRGLADLTEEASR